MRSSTMLAALLAAAPTATIAAPAFRHVVIVFQENRTPDNMFGSNPSFEPGVDIGTSGVNSKGQTVPLTAEPLVECYDISHSHGAFEASLTEGADQDPLGVPDGCTPPANPQYKYIDNSSGTVQPYFDIATGYGFANRMFQTNQGPSFPAHQFIFGGTSAPTRDSPLFASENMSVSRANAGCIAAHDVTVALIDGHGSETSHAPIYPCFEHATLSDLLDAAQPPIGWRYYAPAPGSIWTAPDAIRHICKPGAGRKSCTGAAWTDGSVIANNPAQVLTDIRDCKLQPVSWVIPTAEESDHASSNTGLGPQWVASIVDAVGNQAACAGGESYWNDTAIIITWDDWGGWFDHVKPFAIDTRHGGHHAWGDGYLYGFRVPLMVVSAYTPAHFVDNTILDFGNILYFIEKNFGLGFIGGASKNPYGQYADYHSSTRGSLGEFFTLAAPRAFTPIATTMSASDFINAPKSGLPPDDD